MKYKHEDTIKIISMFALVIIISLMKISNISVQMFVGVIGCILLTFGAVYFSYQGYKKGYKSYGAFMFYFALAGLLMILSQYFDKYNSTFSYNLAVPIPTCIFLAFFTGYKTIVRYGKKEQIEKVRELKVLGIIGIIAFPIIQIGMLVPLFIKL